jgi:hypothetical protein
MNRSSGFEAAIVRIDIAGRTRMQSAGRTAQRATFAQSAWQSEWPMCVNTFLKLDRMFEAILRK